ncbi:MAG: Flavodoxin/ferredoxin--NADP reductase [Candidatus Erwinia impunctatus]|nr:Flavodoxin/ferredoxin--NADP reductase [Culicoides impunctatus]
MTEWIDAEVTALTHWTENLFTLTVSAPITPFVAGQFAKLAMIIEGERIQRAYSYVNAPSDEALSFYLVNVPEGKLSPALHRLQPGDKISISKEAAGFFIIDEVPDCKTLWMLSTGTAIGPYLSILQEGRGLERFEQIVLVHAARYAADLSYLPLMEKLEQRYQGKLRLQTVVSREHCEGALQGRIPALIDQGELERAVGLSMTSEESHIMLCGNPQMVRETQQLLRETRNMRKHFKRKPGHITAENYW